MTGKCVRQVEYTVNSEIIAITQPPTKMWGLIIATHLVEQELPTLSEHLGSPLCYIVVGFVWNGL
jgi:hypothetical protein